MIQDIELRDLFKAESAERLQALEEGLLRLEKNPHDQVMLESVFRAAHSLKGDSQMVGLEGLANLAHQFEDFLNAANRGQSALSISIVRRLYHALDSMRKLAHEAIYGGASGVDVAAVLEYLSADDKPTKKSRTSRKTSTASQGTRAPSPNPQPEHMADLATLHSGDNIAKPDKTPSVFKIDTLRIEPQKLDGLMALSGELTVTKSRIDRRLPEVEEVKDLLEEWSKDAFSNRFMLNDIEHQAPAGTVRRLTEYHEREDRRLERLGNLINQLHGAIYEDNARLDWVANGLEEGIRNVRLLPFSTIFNLFPRMVRDLAYEQRKEVEFILEGKDTTADKRMLEEIKDPIMHLLRNAVDHGLEKPEWREQNGKPRQGTIRLKAFQTSTNIVIEVSDDGNGLDDEAIRRTALKRKLFGEDELAAMPISQLHSLIFTQGFSTSSIVTDISGRGVGLDVVHANIENLKGSIQVQSIPLVGTTFRLILPITLATTRVLIVKEGEHSYALPVEFVQTMRQVQPPEIFAIEGHDAVELDGQPVSVARLSKLLGLSQASSTDTNHSSYQQKSGFPGTLAQQDNPAWIPCIILAIGSERLGLLVDELLDEHEILLKPLGVLLKRVRNVSSAAVLGSGEICVVLNPNDLLKSLWKRSMPSISAAPTQVDKRQLSLLLVEDSITTRTQEKRILEASGYTVVTAVDGLDGWAKLAADAFDAVITDIQMPNMDGLALAAKIRQDKRYQEMPIILVTSMASDEDKRKGIEVGANAYITKSSFDQQVLLDTVRRLV